MPIPNVVAVPAAVGGGGEGGVGGMCLEAAVDVVTKKYPGKSAAAVAGIDSPFRGGK